VHFDGIIRPEKQCIVIFMLDSQRSPDLFASAVIMPSPNKAQEDFIDSLVVNDFGTTIKNLIDYHPILQTSVGKLKFATQVYTTAKFVISCLFVINTIYGASQLARTNPLIFSAVAAAQLSVFVSDWVRDDKNFNNSMTAIGAFSILTGVGSLPSMGLKFLAGGFVNSLSGPVNFVWSGTGNMILGVANNSVSNSIITYASTYMCSKAYNYMIDKFIVVIPELKPIAYEVIRECVFNKTKKAAELTHNPEENSLIYNWTFGLFKHAVNRASGKALDSFEDYANNKIEILFDKATEFLSSCKVERDFVSILNLSGTASVNCFMSPFKFVINNGQDICNLASKIYSGVNTNQAPAVVQIS
jgi:hypothetical protein